VGGTDRTSNLAPVCESCHSLVHDRDLVKLSSLVREGRQRAMASGVKFGRKRTWTDAQAITVREMRDQGLGYGTIATKLNVSVSKVRRILGLI
jgi:DNA invertase Pin-like site-specific DNA recombinase